MEVKFKLDKVSAFALTQIPLLLVSLILAYRRSQQRANIRAYNRRTAPTLMEEVGCPDVQVPDPFVRWARGRGWGGLFS